VLEVPPAAVSEQGALRLIADGTGLAGGLGYVALFGLIAYTYSGSPVGTTFDKSPLLCHDRRRTVPLMSADIRCRLGLHRYRPRRNANELYWECTRCGRRRFGGPPDLRSIGDDFPTPMGEPRPGKAWGRACLAAAEWLIVGMGPRSLLKLADPDWLVVQSVVR
jgi:hypothetical protein